MITQLNSLDALDIGYLGQPSKVQEPCTQITSSVSLNILQGIT